MKHLLIIGVFFLMVKILPAQDSVPDTIIILKSFSVEASRQSAFSSGLKKDDIDSLQRMTRISASAGELLQMQNRIFIKSYGTGNLASSSIRGAGAVHTAVLWNGFNLQNSSNGMTDFSLLPVFFFDDFNIQVGSSGALWGNGAVGGAISLNNKMPEKEGISVALTTITGSFGEFQQQAKVSVRKKKYAGATRVFYKQAENNYLYTNTDLPASPRESLQNAELIQQGLLQENYFLIREDQRLTLNAWYQQSDRNIPAPLGQSASMANQKDNSLRLSSEWNKSKNNGSWAIRSALFLENLDYSDEVQNIYSSSQVLNSVSEVEGNFRLKKYTSLQIGLHNNFSRAVSDGYDNIPEQNRIAVFSSIKIQNKKQSWSGLLSARQEAVYGKVVPFCPFAGIEGKIAGSFKMRANFSGSYRLPTFNDLYWNPGGNPQLKPERGWSQDGALIFNMIREKFTLDAEGTVFNRNIENWIIWLPKNGIWTPQNLMQVWSRGTETSFKVKYSISNKWSVVFSGLTNYIISTNEKSKFPEDESLGKQLIYAPMYSGSGNFSIISKNISLNLNHIYTGYRYTSSDNTEFLEPFHITNIYCNKTFRRKKQSVSVFAGINNVLDRNYQLMAQRPMPGRNYNIGISINLN